MLSGDAQLRRRQSVSGISDYQHPTATTPNQPQFQYDQPILTSADERNKRRANDSDADEMLLPV